MPDRFSGSAVIQSIEQIFSQGGIIMAVLAVVAFIVYSQIIDIWLTIRCHTLPEEHRELTEKTKTLAVWVSVAPLLGLLGTVIGMLTTFQSMGTTSRITGGHPRSDERYRIRYFRGATDNASWVNHRHTGIIAEHWLPAKTPTVRDIRSDKPH